MEAHRKVKAEDWLTQITVQHGNSEALTNLSKSPRAETGTVTDQQNKFDENGFEALRMQLRLGL